MAEPKPQSLPQRLMAAGIKKSHAYQLAAPNISVPRAVRVFRQTGIKIGPIANATDEQIAVLTEFPLGTVGGAAA